FAALAGQAAVLVAIAVALAVAAIAEAVAAVALLALRVVLVLIVLVLVEALLAAFARGIAGRFRLGGRVGGGGRFRRRARGLGGRRARRQRQVGLGRRSGGFAGAFGGGLAHAGLAHALFDGGVDAPGFGRSVLGQVLDSSLRDASARQ